jgi:hypothetical protein
MNIRIILVSLVLTLVACTQPAVSTVVAPVDVTAAKPQQILTETACSTVGGDWRPVCMMGKPACVVTFKDAGKSCADSSECSGRCVTKGGEKPGAETRGICTTNSDPCGCFQLVTKGNADYTLCAD